MLAKLIYLTVEWSGPERQSSAVLEALRERIQQAKLQIEIEALSEDDTETRRFLRELGLNEILGNTPMGAGSMIWVVGDEPIDCFMAPTMDNLDELLKRSELIAKIAALKGSN